MDIAKAASSSLSPFQNDETPGLRPLEGRKYGGQSRPSLPHRPLEHKFILNPDAEVNPRRVEIPVRTSYPQAIYAMTSCKDWRGFRLPSFNKGV